MSQVGDDIFSKTLIWCSHILSFLKFYAIFGWHRPNSHRKMFSTFYAIFRWSHTNIKLRFYCIGFVRIILMRVPAPQSLKQLAVGCLTGLQFLDQANTISSPSCPDPPSFLITLRPLLEVATNVGWWHDRCALSAYLHSSPDSSGLCQLAQGFLSLATVTTWLSLPTLMWTERLCD